MSNDHERGLLAYREQFPVFSSRTYLASQCLGPFPERSHRDVEECLSTRQQHNRALGAWFEIFEATIASIERLLGAPAGSVALRDSATACQAAVLASLEARSGRDRIVATELDFHSSLHLVSGQRRRGFDVVVVPSRDGMRISVDDVVARIDERTAAVCVSMVSRHCALLDVAPVVARAHDVGAIVVVDAYQAVGIVPLDVVALGVDVLVGGNHKWLSGDTGLAFLYVEPALAERLQPVYPGWFGHNDVASYVHAHAFGDEYRPLPGARRFQQGTPPILPLYASRAGLQFVLDAGVERMRSRNLSLTSHLLRGANELGLRVMTPAEPDQRAGGVCVEVPDPEAVVEALANRGIDVDQRRRQVVRVAPHPCNTIDECDRFLDALGEILGLR